VPGSAPTASPDRPAADARRCWLAHRWQTLGPIWPSPAVPPGSGAARSCTGAVAW